MHERFVEANGIRLFCVESGPADGPLVLLVHGWPEFWWSWRRQLPVLGTAGYHAVAVDLPGYGCSDKPDVVYDEAWVNTCLAEAITALGHEQAALVGHDWGGLLVWPFARRFPERTAAVVGVNTPDLPRLPEPPVELMRKVFGHNLYIVQFQDRGPAEWLLGTDVRGWLEGMFRGPTTRRPEVFPDDVIDRYVEVWSQPGAIGPPLEYYRNMDRNWELAADLPEQVTAPALMVTAEHDPVLRPEMSVGMEIRVPDLRRVLIGECGHWTQQEQPEKLNEALLDFLAEATSPPA
ncbi:MAG: alpha/beta hydrolase [Actinomycetota bacterium]|nr:alpha/beta hydrolase [Actinomycetota bacterium]